MAAIAALLALLGLVLGSFLSVVAYRIPRGESIVRPRPSCPSCGTQLRVRDNVPLLGWMLQRGRCRHCGVRIPVRYPLIEVGLAAAFVGAFLAFEDDPAKIALAAALAATLLTITLTDLEHRIIPNKVLIASAVVAVAIAAPTDPDGLPERAIAALAAGGFLFVVALAFKGGMGMGDVKLAAVMGLYLGRAVAPALLIGFAAGAIYGLALIARHGSEARKRQVPFGPFLAFGGLIAIFVGDEIVDWYTDTFFEG
jgi:leader peptidase (prepilin peptidase) / N-methyltransferase